MTETLPLFDLSPTGQLITEPSAVVPCMWHRGQGPESTHRVVFAVDLMHARWWQWGGIRPDGGLESCGGGPVRLHWVGAGCCTSCVDRNAGAGLATPGVVEHYIPITPAA